MTGQRRQHRGDRGAQTWSFSEQSWLWRSSPSSSSQEWAQGWASGDVLQVRLKNLEQHSCSLTAQTASSLNGFFWKVLSPEPWKKVPEKYSKNAEPPPTRSSFHASFSADHVLISLTQVAELTALKTRKTLSQRGCDGSGRGEDGYCNLQDTGNSPNAMMDTNRIYPGLTQPLQEMQNTLGESLKTLTGNTLIFDVYRVFVRECVLWSYFDKLLKVILVYFMIIYGFYI